MNGETGGVQITSELSRFDFFRTEAFNVYSERAPYGNHCSSAPLLSRYCDKNFHTQPCWAEIERIAGQLKRPEQAKTAELEHIYGT